MYTQYTIFIIKKKITLDYSKSAAKGFLQGTQERVRNSRGKRAISVRAIEVLLWLKFRKNIKDCSRLIASYESISKFSNYIK